MLRDFILNSEGCFCFKEDFCKEKQKKKKKNQKMQEIKSLVQANGSCIFVIIWIIRISFYGKKEK